MCPASVSSKYALPPAAAYMREPLGRRVADGLTPPIVNFPSGLVVEAVYVRENVDAVLFLIQYLTEFVSYYKNTILQSQIHFD